MVGVADFYIIEESTIVHSRDLLSQCSSSYLCFSLSEGGGGGGN